MTRTWSLLVVSVVLFLAWATSVEAVADGQGSPNGPFLRTAPATEELVKEVVGEFRMKRQEVSSSLTPVMIIPPLTGVKLKAELLGYNSSHWYCLTEWREWFTIWFNYYAMFPIDCWYEQMTLHFDPRTGRSFNTSGVAIRPTDYGGVGGVEYMDDAKQAGLFNTTIAILTQLGWTVGLNLRAAPYDFRLGPMTYVKEDWPRLKSLIEETYYMNNQSKVACVSLSMGGPYFLGFLNQQSQAWKDKFIHSYVSWDGAFGGSMSALTSLMSTTNFWSQFVPNPQQMVELLQTWPSITWLLPWAQVYGYRTWATTISPPASYGPSNFSAMLSLAKGYNAAPIFDVLKTNGWYTFDAPGVECHSFFGTQVRTALHVTYSTSRFDDFPVTVYGDGDGTIPEAGLRLFEQWRGKQAKPIYSYPIPGLVHGQSVFNKEVQRMFVQILTTPQA